MSDKLLFEDELRRSYLDYAMSVIVGRALPDAYDGCKPVQRRILYSMWENGVTYNKKHKKSAQIVGAVLGDYHPHGFESIYKCLARLTLDFAMNVPLIDGQGHFGSIDGDKAAAMRYTEARLAAITATMLEECDCNAVPVVSNYDNSKTIAEVLPVQFPQLLVNGSEGIAVGYATNILPHNLTEVVNATICLIDNPEATTEELTQHIRAPDFPGGGTIHVTPTLAQIYKTGKGSCILRSAITIEQINNRESVIITEIPYQNTKSKIIESIVNLIQNETLVEIAEFRDESSKEGIRIALDLKRGAPSEVVKQKLYQYTPLQSRIHTNMMAIHQQTPKVLNLRDILTIFLDKRDTIIVNRTLFYLHKAKSRAHAVLGLLFAVSQLNEVIKTIKSSQNVSEARTNLMQIKWASKDHQQYLQYDTIGNNNEFYQLSLAQVNAILEIRLQSLTALEHDKLLNELMELSQNIKQYNNILANKSVRAQLMKEELRNIDKQIGRPRRTQITHDTYSTSQEDVIANEDCVVILTHNGYIKRTLLEDYHTQKRGGIGKLCSSQKDPISKICIANSHDTILFFSSNGRVYASKTYSIPTGTHSTKGRAMVNVLPLTNTEQISALMSIPRQIESKMHLVFVTSNGYVRKNKLSDFASIRSNGKIAIALEPNEYLIDVLLVKNHDELLLTASNGKSVRFESSEIRTFNSRTSHGVLGMRLDSNHKVVSVTQLDSTVKEILTVTKLGYGKRSKIADYRLSKRGAKGVITTAISPQTGDVLGAYSINSGSDILLINSNRQVVRCKASEIRLSNRVSRGVRLIKLDSNITLEHATTINEE